MSAIGLRVGPFEITESVEVPEPGDWYVAERTGLTRRQPTVVLVKLLPPTARQPDRAALQQEFEALRVVEGPHIPRPVAFYEGTGAMALDAPPSVPLTEVIEARAAGQITMTPATLLDLALELAETLQHVHHKGRHHGHLSADCVTIAADGSLWLFGFATADSSEPPTHWMAPERARRTPVGPHTDQWSLAALLAALITGHAAWDGEDPVDAAREGDPETICGPVERQWPALGRLFRRMLEPEPGNRFPTMQPVRQELLALSRKAGGQSDRRDLGAAIMRRHQREAPEDEGIPVEFTAESLAHATDAGEDDASDHDATEQVIPSESDAGAPVTDDDPTPPQPSENQPSSSDNPDTEDGPPQLLAAVVYDETQEAARTPAPPLPEEPIAVVRPDVHPDDVPVAAATNAEPAPTMSGKDEKDNKAQEDADLLSGLDPKLKALIAADTMEADLEPSEPTQLFDGMQDPELAALIAASIDDDEDDEDPDTGGSEPTQLFDSSNPELAELVRMAQAAEVAEISGALADDNVGFAAALADASDPSDAGITAVPATDSEGRPVERDPESMDVPALTADQLMAQVNESAGVDTSPVRPPPEAEPSIVQKVAPALVAVMIVLMLIWAYVTYG